MPNISIFNDNLYNYVIELKNFQMGMSEMARDRLLYMLKSLKITINIFSTSFLMKICNFGDVESADRNKA